MARFDKRPGDATHYHKNRMAQADRVDSMYRADSKDRRIAELEGVIKDLVHHLEEIDSDIMPYMIALADAGTHRSDGYWAIDCIFSDGGPPFADELEETQKEIKETLSACALLAKCQRTTNLTDISSSNKDDEK